MRVYFQDGVQVTLRLVAVATRTLDKRDVPMFVDVVRKTQPNPIHESNNG